MLPIVYGNLRWKVVTKKLHDRIEAARYPNESCGFSTSELTSLPAPVQRFFRAALSDGQRMVSAVRMEQTGTFNLDEMSGYWKPFAAVQRVVTRRPGFIWDARIMMFPGIPVRVRDAYVAGEGVLQAAVFGLFPVANLRGKEELARGELMRFLAEAAWYPTALLPSQGVFWSAVDDCSANATLREHDVTVTLLFRFNENDALIDTVRAERRARTTGAAVVTMPWQCRVWNYSIRDGLRVPLEGEAAWVHPTGPKPYWLGQITRASYEFSK